MTSSPGVRGVQPPGRKNKKPPTSLSTSKLGMRLIVTFLRGRESFSGGLQRTQRPGSERTERSPETVGPCPTTKTRSSSGIPVYSLLQHFDSDLFKECVRRTHAYNMSMMTLCDLVECIFESVCQRGNSQSRWSFSPNQEMTRGLS